MTTTNFQVWVGDITYVRLKHRFIYVALLMDVFTRMIRGWNLSQHLTQSLTLDPLEPALHDRVPEIHHSDQGVQYLSSAYLLKLKEHDIQISVARRFLINMSITISTEVWTIFFSVRLREAAALL